MATAGSGFIVEGVQVNCLSLRSAAERIVSDCTDDRSFGVFTLNLDHVVKLRRNRAFRTAYGHARYVTADGFPIVLAGRLGGTPTERVTGADLIEPLCEACAEQRLPVYLFGSTFASLAGAARHLRAKYPRLEIAGVSAPEANFDPNSPSAVEHAQRIADSGAKICFVALGAPKQELFASAVIDHVPGTAFVCIGAGLDFLAGIQKRAPQWVRSIGAEWLWRLSMNPGRLARRYLDCIKVLPRVLLPATIPRTWAYVANDRRASSSMPMTQTADAAGASVERLQLSTTSAPTNHVLLTVSGSIPPSIAADIDAQRRPRADYLQLAHAMQADLLDYSKARAATGTAGRLIERIGGANLLLAYACWRERARYRTIVTDGEQVGLPLAALLAGSRRRPRHVMIGHVLSVPKKALLVDALRLHSRIDTWVVYSKAQRDFIQARWRIDDARIAHIPFMVDDAFFAPERTSPAALSRLRICAVGLERRDYRTLIRAVDGLDVDVVIAAASPWSKRRDDTAGHSLPSNVTVAKFSQFELRQLLADSAFLVMPLQDVDFQAGVTAILEAMAMGKPVICSAAAGQTDVIVEGETGRYVPVGDVAALRAAIERLLGEPEEIRRLGANARTAVERNFSLNQYGWRFKQIVEAADTRAQG